MTISKARKKFEELKTQILVDGKVDIIEAYALLDFIEEYAKTGNEKFVKFKNTITKCSADKVITDEESQLIVNEINSMTSFLRIEQLVEWTFFGILAIGVVGYAIYLML